MILGRTLLTLTLLLVSQDKIPTQAFSHHEKVPGETFINASTRVPEELWF